jgi:hypothetical protein
MEVTLGRDLAGKLPTRRQLLAIAAAGGAAAAAGVTGTRKASAVLNDSIVGTWFATYEHPASTRHLGMWTYHADGTVVGTSDSHLSQTPGHGAWMSLGNNQFAQSSIEILVDAAGNLAGTRQSSTDITFDPAQDLLHNMSRVNSYDASGNLVESVNTSASAKRLPFMRLSDPIPPAINATS